MTTPPPCQKLLVLIPALNESATIVSVVENVQRLLGCDILVVDDASTDNTRQAAFRAGARVLSHALCLGAWGAIRTGLHYAQREGYDVVITMDADGQHDAGHIPLLLDPISEGRADVVIGACPQRGSLARKLTWFFFRHLTRLKIQDLTSGFRAYSAQAVKKLLQTETGLLDYQDIGVLIYLRRSGLVITEVPVIMACRKAGMSRVFSSWSAVCSYLLTTLLVCISKTRLPFSD